MTDEKFTFIEDVRDKKRTATCAHHKRTHCGKGGKVRFPSDFKTKKELRAMNGEVKSYKLNDPMGWEEFRAMPDDIKVAYITALRKKYNVSDTALAKMFGCSQPVVSKEMRRLGVQSERSGNAVWDKDGWCAWVNGVKLEAKAASEDVREEAAERLEHIIAEMVEEVKACVESVPEGSKKCDEEVPEEEEKCDCTRAIPGCGRMELEGTVTECMNTLKQLLADSSVKLTVAWAVKQNG